MDQVTHCKRRRLRNLCFLLSLPVLLCFGNGVYSQSTYEVRKVFGRLHRVEVDKNQPAAPIVGLNLHGARLGDSALLELAAFPFLRNLDLSSDRFVSNRGFQSLSGLHSLESLSLNNTRADDSTIDFLVPLGRLRDVSVASTMITTRE